MENNLYGPKERIFFFSGSENRKLLGFLHNSNVATPSRGIIFCHPFAEEKNMSHRVLVKTARLIAASGIPVFRFDFSGCGDSEGDLQFSSVEKWQRDLDSAIKFFSKETGVSTILLLGLRLGASLALLHNQSDSKIGGLILWQPVLDFSVHIKQFLRQTISAEISRGRKKGCGENNVTDFLQDTSTKYVIGYPIAKHLYDSFNDIGKKPVNIVPSVPVFILSISLMIQPDFTIRNYSEKLHDAGAPVTLQHIEEEPFWDRYWRWECNSPAEATLQWMQNIT